MTTRRLPRWPSGRWRPAVWSAPGSSAPARQRVGLGSYLYGRRVTTTLAEKVTDIDPLEGLTASTVACSLVLLASFMALPVSTTHVSTGAIVGASLRAGTQSVRWRTVASIVTAWVITLPVAGVLAALGLDRAEPVRAQSS